MTEDDAVPARFQVDFTGKVLGSYRVDQKLAEGGMGSVWLAHDTSLDQRVVVKVPHARFLSESGFRARFRREISELVRLEHPRIVRILARGEVEEVPYFVLQYLGGGSLEDRLKRLGGREEIAGVRHWLVPTAETLDFIHARGVVHRDVKPGNILFDEGAHVFLSDFGVVKALGDSEDAALTAAGTGVGSPYYMAPEQSVGGAPTGAADQYALASTLYEALAGDPPYGRGTTVQILLRKQKESAPRVSAKVPGLPSACDAAMTRALDPDPAKRFPSCVAFVEAFLAPLTPESPSARGRRRFVIPIVAAALLAAVAGVALAAGWFRKDAPAETPGLVDSVRLVSPGAEPRRALRYHWTAGTKDVLHRTDKSEVKFTPTPPFETPPDVSEWSFTAEVLSVDAGGTARIAWVGQRTSEPGPSPIPGRPTPIQRVDFRATVDPTGAMTDVEAQVGDEEAEDPGSTENPELIEVRAKFESLLPRLPTEPVGAGAVWEVTQEANMFGMRPRITSTCVLADVEGERVHVQSRFSMNAPPTGLTGAIFGGAEVTMLTFLASGEQDCRFDLDHAVVTEASMQGTFSFSFMGPSDDGSRKTYKIDGKMSEDGKRE